jgi:ribonuclease HI
MAVKKARVSGSSKNVTKPIKSLLAQELADSLPEGWSKPALYLFCDGGCKYIRDPITKKTSSTGAGGWGTALLLIEQDEEPFVTYLSGGHPTTTNNQMELQAIIDGLSAVNQFPELIDGSMRLHVISDSQYCIRGITEWWSGWVQRDFADVKNMAYWKQMQLAIKKFGKKQRITWHHCRGHRNASDFPPASWDRFTAIGNDAADRLATLGRYKIENKTKQ